MTHTVLLGAPAELDVVLVETVVAVVVVPEAVLVFVAVDVVNVTVGWNE